VLTVVISMNFGFSVVLWAGSLLYAVAFAGLSRIPTSVASAGSAQP
jgi:hypothetical protein